MIELKNKKTGRISVESDEDYAWMLKHNPALLTRFSVTQMRMRPIIPSLKQEVPLELKKIKTTKNDG